MLSNNSFDSKQFSHHQAHIHGDGCAQMTMHDVNMFSNENLSQQWEDIQWTKE
jgi:hypothetical protein